MSKLGSTLKMRFFLAFFITWIASFSGSSAQAADSAVHGTYAGGLLGGLSVGNGAALFSFGAEANYKFLPPIEVGAQITYFSQSITLNGQTTSNSNVYLLAQGAYELEQIEGLRVGLDLGVAFATSATSFALGPFAGYDYAISPLFSVGAEANYIILTAAGSNNFFQAFATVKYWF